MIFSARKVRRVGETLKLIGMLSLLKHIVEIRGSESDMCFFRSSDIKVISHFPY